MSFVNMVSCCCGQQLVYRDAALLLRGVVHSATSPCYLIDPHYNHKDSQMDFSTYVRKPFAVEAIQITKENIAEVAKHVGDLRAKEDGTPYILVDRRLVPNVARVYVGFFMTKMGENVRCYSPKIFREQFIPKSDDIQPWLDFLAEGDQVVPA